MATVYLYGCLGLLTSMIVFAILHFRTIGEVHSSLEHKVIPTPSLQDLWQRVRLRCAPEVMLFFTSTTPVAHRSLVHFAETKMAVFEHKEMFTYTILC